NRADPAGNSQCVHAWPLGRSGGDHRGWLRVVIASHSRSGRRTTLDRRRTRRTFCAGVLPRGPALPGGSRSGDLDRPRALGTPWCVARSHGGPCHRYRGARDHSGRDRRNGHHRQGPQAWCADRDRVSQRPHGACRADHWCFVSRREPDAAPGWAMKLLILGGTKFLGRHLVDAARSAGHDVTLLNRGSRPGLFRGVEELRGDRSQGADGLAALRGRRWDAVVDTSGYVPRLVGASAQLLRDAVGRYVFVSSISVYSEFAEAPDESSPVAELTDPNSEDIARDYGALKAACERVVTATFGPRALNIRPGLIVGPFDPSGRFTYWPLRVACGGDVLAPADPEADVQFIDARDLARWTVQLIERDVGGVFNATGPAQRLRFGAFLEAARSALHAQCDFTWVSAAFLHTQGVQPWIELPLWVDDAPGLNRVSIARALREVLDFAALDKTIVDTYDWAQA